MVSAAACLVPRPKRLEWTREWRAELWQLRHRRRRAKVGLGELSERLSLAYGLLADALWLQVDWVRETARGSASACLLRLLFSCLVCAAMEWMVVGSWLSFGRVLRSHFVAGYVFVAVPAVFVAVATYPLRPLRCDRRDIRADGSRPARARWNVFLWAKVTLTLTLGFLASIVATVPLRATIGSRADWVELLLWAVVVTTGLRWALLNQEQRCQRCLRTLCEPTRIGPPSRNFLDWNGTELVCSNGHGLLQVPEMPGSWCWYDLWVELDAGWQGAIPG